MWSVLTAMTSGFAFEPCWVAPVSGVKARSAGRFRWRCRPVRSRSRRLGWCQYLRWGGAESVPPTQRAHRRLAIRQSSVNDRRAAVSSRQRRPPLVLPRDVKENRSGHGELDVAPSTAAKLIEVSACCGRHRLRAHGHSRSIRAGAGRAGGMVARTWMQAIAAEWLSIPLLSHLLRVARHIQGRVADCPG